MSPSKIGTRSSVQLHTSFEESYCSPWDLHIQEEKLKLLNEQYQTSLTKPSAPPIDDMFDSFNVNNPSTSSSYNRINRSPHPTSSLRRSSSNTRKSLINLSLLPPELPPLPKDGLLKNFQCNMHHNNRYRNSVLENLDLPAKTNCHCLHQHKTCSGTDTSRSFLFAASSPFNQRSKRHETKSTALIAENSPARSFEAALIRLKHLSSSVQNNSSNRMETCYDQPWDKIQKSLINNLPSVNNGNGGSLQQIPCIEKIKQRCSHLEDIKKIPIDHYFWYHHRMSRRQAEHILQSRPPGSFLVRQCESGSQNDYSLSIKTLQGCMHMRICYSGGFYILGECSRPFSSILCMIKYFTQVFVPIRGAVHVKLGTPVLRCEILSTSSCSNEELL